MRLENVLNMNIEAKVTDEELTLGMEVNTRKDIMDLMTNKELERMKELITEISDIYNVAITRDIKEEMGIEFSNCERTINREIEEKELEDEVQKAYDKLSDEYKAKADKMLEDIDKLKTPEEKAKRVLEEIVSNIFNI